MESYFPAATVYSRSCILRPFLAVSPVELRSTATSRSLKVSLHHYLTASPAASHLSRSTFRITCCTASLDLARASFYPSPRAVKRGDPNYVYGIIAPRGIRFTDILIRVLFILRNLTFGSRRRRDIAPIAEKAHAEMRARSVRVTDRAGVARR